MRRTEGLLALALIFAFALCFTALARAEDTTAPVNQRLLVSSAEARFTFTAPSNNLYTFRIFGASNASGTLYAYGDSAPLALGDGFSFSARLITGARYLLVVKNGQGGAVEIMRDALGRSFDRPIQLNNLEDGYDKVIARAYDTHWYAFTAPTSGAYIVTTTSEIDTVGYLLDEEGREIASSDDAYAPYERNFRLVADLEAGRTYLLRVSAKGDMSGAYHLSVIAPDPAAPKLSGIALDFQELALRSSESRQLTATLEPAGARADIKWLSTDGSVARVSQTGEVTAVAPGSCDVIAFSGEAVQAVCRVTVAFIPLQEVHFELDALEIPRKQSAQLGYAVMPLDASDRRMTFESSDDSVATVDDRGVVTGVAEGQAVITVTSVDGGFKSQLTVTVTRAEPVYRALVMGEQRYADGRLRIGSVNTTQGMADLLKNAGVPGGYNVTMKLDSTRKDLVAAIRNTFRDAEPTDVSLFYINCHGGFDSGRAWLELHDGSRVTAQQLEQMLRRIPGTVVVMIDCCQSGAFLSRTAHFDFNRGVLQAFTGGAATSFTLSKYRVMTSSSSAQDSYRISFSGADSEAAMATVFVRALSEAGGWDLIKDRKTSLRADLDKNRVVTFEEAYRYARRRVRYYLNQSKVPVEQDVQVFPMGSMFTLFRR
jgi:hypothetical protein